MFYILFILGVFSNICYSNVYSEIPSFTSKILDTVEKSENFDQAAEEIWGDLLKEYTVKVIQQIRRYSPQFIPGKKVDVPSQCLNFLYAHDGWVSLKAGYGLDIFEEPVCIPGRTLEITRREIVKLLTKYVNQVLLDNGFIPKISWRAIGTTGPNSDIDYSIRGNCSSFSSAQQTRCYKQKDYAEVIAKILFDLLVTYIFKLPPGQIFDTEAYTDPDYQIRKYWERLKQILNKKRPSKADKDELNKYISYVLTLSQLQMARTLSHPIVYHGHKILVWQEYKNFWRGSRFTELLHDAELFAHLTNFGRDKERIFLRRYRDILLITEALNDSKSIFERSLYQLLRNTFYPESYYTPGALTFTCFSTDHRSQGFITAVNEKLNRRHPFLSAEEINSIGIGSGLLEMIPLEYTSAIAENIAYALHKLQEGEKGDNDTLFKRFLNASKYLLRVAIACEEYSKIKPYLFSAKDLRELKQFSSQLERLKRGFPPITSVEVVEEFLETSFVDMDLSSLIDSISFYSKDLYEIGFKKWAISDHKVDLIQQTTFPLAKCLLQVGKDKSGSKNFCVNKKILKVLDSNPNLQIKEKVLKSQRLALLLNYLAGYKTSQHPSMKAATQVEQKKLEQSIRLPLIKGGEAKMVEYKTFKQQANALRSFVVALITMFQTVTKDMEKEVGTFTCLELSHRLEGLRRQDLTEEIRSH